MPDGTIIRGVPDDATKDEVLRRYSASQSAPAQAPSERQQFMSSVIGRGLRGLQDPIDAGAQLLSRAAASMIPGLEGEPARVDALVRKDAAEYDAARQAAGQSGFDVPRTIGSTALQMLALRGLPTPVAASSLPARVGIGAGAGASYGALQPVTEGDFGDEKLKQIGLGAATGAVAAPLTELLARAVMPKGSDALRLLRSEGVNPTVGQMGGGAIKRAEEKLASLPVVGAVIRKGQERATEQLNDAAWNRALAPIGQTLPKGVTGREAVAHVDDAIGRNYESILNRIGAAPIDRQLVNDLSSLGGLLNQLPKDKSQQYAQIVKAEIVDRVQNNTLTGEAIKAAESNLGQIARRYANANDADQATLGRALFEAQHTLREWLARAAPAEAAALKANNRAYAEFLRPLRASAALGAEEGTFTAAQLQSAVKALDRTKHKKGFATGDALMQDLADAGKTVLSPKVPNSGTADRAFGGMFPFAAPAAAASLMGNPALYLAALPGLLYTRPGQALAGAYMTGAQPLRQPIADAVRGSLPLAGAGLYGLLGEP